MLMPLRMKRDAKGRSIERGQKRRGSVERRKSLERTKARGQHDESRVDVSFPANSRTMHTNQPSLRQLYPSSFSLSPRLNLLPSRFLPSRFPQHRAVGVRGKRKRCSLCSKETERVQGKRPSDWLDGGGAGHWLVPTFADRCSRLFFIHSRLSLLDSIPMTCFYDP